MDLGLKDKIVLVTGANGGIGLATCQGFLEEGAIVFAGYRGEKSRMEPLLSWAKDRRIGPERVIPLEIDLTDEQGLRKTVQDQIIKTKGRIDVLVNNAGHVIESPFAITTDEDWESVFESNVMTTVRLSRVICREMIHQKKGCIVNVSSIVAHAVGRGLAAYASSKAALSRLTQIMAIELARKNIRVNAVAPGAIRTRMSSQLITLGHEELMEHTPMKRVGEPEEAARSILFLASDLAAGFMTGHILYVDGGVSL